MAKETLQPQPGLHFTSEINPVIEHLPGLVLAPNVPQELSPLLAHMKQQILNSLKKIQEQEAEFQICGPDWCRQKSKKAGEDHAHVIIKTYGSTYALPNKDPQANKQALDSGNLDMYMIYKGHEPIGTACMVFGSDGWAELGRSASLGGVGNQLIQNLRVIRWLTEESMSKQAIGIFATCRTVPDRNISAVSEPEWMRGGQAVCHMWSTMPNILVGGFGPLYKKHGALEQFAYTFISRKPTWIPSTAWIADRVDKNFVSDWCENYQIAKKDIHIPGSIREDETRFSVGYPPLKSGITHLVHGEVFISDHQGQQSLEKALSELDRVEVPFVQVQVPIDRDSIPIQESLRSRDFQAFLFTPGIADHQPPLLWFGKKRLDVPVVETYWKDEAKRNPFWSKNLSLHASRIAHNW